MKLLFTLLIVAAVCLSASCGGGDDDNLAVSTNSGCLTSQENTESKRFKRESIFVRSYTEKDEKSHEETVTDEDYIDETIDWEVSEDSLTIWHVNDTSYCAPELIATYEIEGGRIIVREALVDEETVARCSCRITSSHTIEEIERGDYKVIFYFNKVRFEDEWRDNVSFDVTI